MYEYLNAQKKKSSLYLYTHMSLALQTDEHLKINIEIQEELSEKSLQKLPQTQQSKYKYNNIERRNAYAGNA